MKREIFFMKYLYLILVLVQEYRFSKINPGAIIQIPKNAIKVACLRLLSRYSKMKLFKMKLECQELKC